MFRKARKPGEAVPEIGGVWWVHHYRHRVSHPVKMDLDYFPTCLECGDKVRFEEAPIPEAAKSTPISEDVHFRRYKSERAIS